MPDKLYLENLEEWVIDQGKSVTYRWLSSALNVAANTAKQYVVCSFVLAIASFARAGPGVWGVRADGRSSRLPHRRM